MTPAVPRDIAPLTTTLPAPPKASSRLVAVSAPPRVSVPASLPKREAAVTVTAPLRVLSPERFWRTPEVAERPVPVTVKGSAEVIPPVTWTAAPEEMMVVPTAEPRAVLLPMLSAPSKIFVTPE